MTEQLAIIREPRFGLNDRDEVVLTFQAYLDESRASQQQLTADEAVHLLKVMGISDVNRLEGKPVWMDTSRRGISTFVRAWGDHR